jgi:hypothetical protein
MQARSQNKKDKREVWWICHLCILMCPPAAEVHNNSSSKEDPEECVGLERSGTRCQRAQDR